MARVPHLFAQVSVDPVALALPDSPRQVGQKPVELGGGLSSTRHAPGPETHGGHSEGAPLVLPQHVGGELGAAEQPVEARIQGAVLGDALLVGGVRVGPARR